MDGSVRPHGPEDWTAYRYCKCGTLAWAIVKPLPFALHAPKYGETLICRDCGRDNSRRPFIRYQWWWLRKHTRRRKLRFLAHRLLDRIAGIRGIHV